MASSANTRVAVAVGVITRGQQYFVCRRKSHQHQGDKWEFPGGKVDAGESVSQALARELFEEIDIQVLSCSHLLDIEHDYEDKSVVLHIYLVDNFSGEPKGKEGQQSKWVSAKELQTLNFPKANQAIIEHLINQ